MDGSSRAAPGFEDINSEAALIHPARACFLTRAIDAAAQMSRVFQPVTDCWDLVYKVYKEFTRHGGNAWTFLEQGSQVILIHCNEGVCLTTCAYNISVRVDNNFLEISDSIWQKCQVAP
jgi:hypothetical protein